MKIQKYGLNTVTILNSPCYEFQHRIQRALPIISITSVSSGLSPVGKIISNAVFPSNDFLPSSVGRELSNCRTDPRVLSAGRDSAPLAHLAIVMLTLYPHPPHHHQTKPAYSQLSYHCTLLWQVLLQPFYQTKWTTSRSVCPPSLSTFAPPHFEKVEKGQTKAVNLYT